MSRFRGGNMTCGVIAAFRRLRAGLNKATLSGLHRALLRIVFGQWRISAACIEVAEMRHDVKRGTRAFSRMRSLRLLSVEMATPQAWAASIASQYRPRGADEEAGGSLDFVKGSARAHQAAQFVDTRPAYRAGPRRH